MELGMYGIIVDTSNLSDNLESIQGEFYCTTVLYFAQINKIFWQNATFTISSRFQGQVFDLIFIQVRAG